MEQCTVYVGLDVHKDLISVALAHGDGQVVEMGQIANAPAAVGHLASKLADRHGPLAFAYEAGPCGYGLYRQLRRLGHACMVVAPSLIPRRPGDRIKTDRRDAITLARLLRSGDLTRVWVPDERHEAIRDLVRCREAFKQVERRCRQRMCGFLLRHGRHYDGRNWTQGHRRWLEGQAFEDPALRTVFTHYLHAIVEAEERVGQLEREMEAALASWSLCPLVRALMALRGVKLITAMTLVAELGDVSRFRRAGELMGFLGMVPGEHSSGSSRRQLGITKSGNARVRRVLVESAWSYRHRPRMTTSLRARGRDASEAVRAVCWKAQKRLHSRYCRLRSRGKAPQSAITAVARELVGFVWAIGCQTMQEQQASAQVCA